MNTDEIKTTGQVEPEDGYNPVAETGSLSHGEMKDILNSPGEALTPGFGEHWYSGMGHEVARGLGNIGTFLKRGGESSSAPDVLGVNSYVRNDGHTGRIRDLPEKPVTRYEPPDIHGSSHFSVMLGDVVGMAPAFGAFAVHPLLGGVVAGSMAADKAAQEADDRGLTGSAKNWFVATSAAENAAMASLPGGVGLKAASPVLKYGSRFIVGAGIGSGIAEGGSWGRAQVLDSYGYHGQADQMRQADAEARLSNAVISGLFNIAGGRHHESSYVAPDMQFAQDIIHEKWAISEHVAKIAELDAQQNQLLNAGVKGSGKALSDGRAKLKESLSAIESERREAKASLEAVRARHDLIAAGNAESIPLMTKDAATSVSVHDNYVHESAPGIPADVSTQNAHIRAMNSASEAVVTGGRFSADEHIGEQHTFIAPKSDGGLLEGEAARFQMSKESLERVDSIVALAREDSGLKSEKGTAGNAGGLGVQEHVGATSAKIEAIREQHPELAAQLDEHLRVATGEHAMEHVEAEVFNIAAACAIRNGG